MNIFVLSPGRSGSMTFARACSHITNFTSAHESATKELSHERYTLKYPDNHIEIDNRLCWFIGTLDKLYGDDAYYVKLNRDRQKLINSFSKRVKLKSGIIRAFAVGIMQQKPMSIPSVGYKWAINNYLTTIDNNIDLLLKHKTNVSYINIDNALDEFIDFWDNIRAEGNLNTALGEFKIIYNKSTSS